MSRVSKKLTLAALVQRQVIDLTLLDCGHGSCTHPALLEPPRRGLALTTRLGDFIMRNSLFVAATLLLAATSPAAALTVTLGDQDFADGTILQFSWIFQNSSVGEPSPFDGFIGSDQADGSNFTASFTFNYAPGPYTAATLTFGIVDHDSALPGDEVASFTADGVDLTAALNAAFNASGGTQGEVNVYTLDLAPLLSELADGSITFELMLQGNGVRDSGIPYTNGAGLDFAQLNLREPDDVPVPEPGTLALFGVALAGLAVRRQHQSP